MNLAELHRMTEGQPQRLFFMPSYGNGWRSGRGDAPIDYQLMRERGAFELCAEGVFTWGEEYRGFYGMVSESIHPLSGHRFVCWLMSKSDPIIDGDRTKRWDFYFSKQERTGDDRDFVSPDDAGVGYGVPVIRREPHQCMGAVTRRVVRKLY